MHLFLEQKRNPAFQWFLGAFLSLIGTGCKGSYYEDNFGAFTDIPVFEIHRAGVLKRVPVSDEIPLWLHSERTKRAVSTHPESNDKKNRSFYRYDYEEYSADKSTLEKVTIDLLVLADYSVYDDFMEKAGNDSYSAESAIRQYYSSVLQEVNRIYSGFSTKTHFFNINPVGIIVAKQLRYSPWVDLPEIFNYEVDKFTIDAFQVLRSLKKWVTNHYNHLPEHDHAVAITKKDLTRFKDHLAQGIAYVRSICKRGESLSVVEDVGAMATVSIVAHELAHSLGAEHDGHSENWRCTYSQNYLMVPSVSSRFDTMANSFTFSDCTVKQIQQYLKSHRMDTKCLEKSPSKLSGIHSGRLQDLSRTRIPGQIYNVDQQCQHAFGKQYRYCGDQDYYLSQLCHQLWCRNTEESRFRPCYSRHYLPALYGTSCGHHMWCINGACVEDRKAPAQASCRFGDRDNGFCVNLAIKKPNHCKISTFRRFCCKTCKNLRYFRRVRHRRYRRNRSRRKHV